MQLDTRRNSGRIPAPDNVRRLYDLTGQFVRSLYAHDQYGPNQPWGGHHDFGLIQHRFRWGMSEYWDAISFHLDGGQIRHRYDLSYQPRELTGGRYYGMHFSSEDIVPEPDYYEDDEDRDPEEEW